MKTYQSIFINPNVPVVSVPLCQLLVDDFFSGYVGIPAEVYLRP